MSSWEDDRPENQEDFQESQNSLNLSRLATCNSYSTLGYDSFDNYDDDHALLKPMFSILSIESFDADEEYSGDGKEEEENNNNVNSNNSTRGCLFSDSDDEKHQMGSCYSLPTTPLQQKQGNALFMGEAKQYLSDSGGRKTRRRKRLLRRRKWEDVELVKDVSFEGDDEEEEDLNEMKNAERGYNNNFSNSFSGDSENGGGGLRVITRPKGGRRSLCMDMEEVKACRDLGFELEHERMFDLSTMSSGLALSASTLDTATISSGGSSPIPNWRISSPGDDPRDVKARLKVWAQAVAIASTSRPGFS